METIFFIIAIASSILLVLMLVKPEWVFMQYKQQKTEINFKKSNFISDMFDKETLSSIQMRKDISERLKQQGFVFFESNGRMNWGMIGSIKSRYDGNGKKGEMKNRIILFGTNFYVQDSDFPCNTDNLKLIADIQKEFADTTRDERGVICVDEKGIGA